MTSSAEPKPASDARGQCAKIVVLSLLCRVRNTIMYAFSWRTVFVPTRVKFWCLFPSLLRYAGNKHQNNHLVSAETVRNTRVHTLFSIYFSSASTLVIINNGLVHVFNRNHHRGRTTESALKYISPIGEYGISTYTVAMPTSRLPLLIWKTGRVSEYWSSAIKVEVMWQTYDCLFSNNVNVMKYIVYKGAPHLRCKVVVFISRVII